MGAKPRIIPPITTERKVSERTLVFLIGAVQFINVLDFVMVLPMGPDFARGLGIDRSNLGLIGGAYTAAAAVSGLLGSFFLDRFDRRSGLAVAMIGLVVGTASGALATGLYSLMAARVVAGLFGGPATSLSFSIIADMVPAERRGKAVGAVMGAFSVASVVGVPLGLELARRGGWQMPFLSTAGLGVVIVAAVISWLPPMRGHLEGRDAGAPRTALRELFERPLVLMSYSMTALVMLSGFLIIPNISTFVQENLHFPRAQLSSLYLGGGVVSFFATRFGGILVDRFGSFRTGAVGVTLMLGVQLAWFVLSPPPLPVLAVFMSYMLALGLRNVAYNTLTSKVPSPRERARFMSIQSSVQHAASALGAMLSAKMLHELPDHSLAGMRTVAILAMALTALVPLLLFVVERGVRITRAAG
jgi:predicted MFS family arabinose efflux permease